VWRSGGSGEPFYRARRAREGGAGGVHGQWVARADVRDDVGGWGRGGVMLETSAGGGGERGKDGVERGEVLARACPSSAWLRVQTIGLFWACGLVQ
jgi:hypothetical protein